MIKIKNIEHTKDYSLKIKFDDGTEKILEFDKITDFTGAAEPLKNLDYFKKVMLLRNGRSFGWENGYDCCADWAFEI